VSDLAASELRADLDALSDLSADDLVQLYRDVLTGLLDKHCLDVKVRQWQTEESDAVVRRRLSCCPLTHKSR